MNIPLSDLVNPVTKGKLIQKEGYLYNQDGTKCAQIFEDEQRLDWISFNQYSELDTRVLREINKYDHWANSQQIKTGKEIDIANFDINAEAIYLGNENFVNLNLDLSRLIKGKKVLDIGGSCIDTWRILAAGASEVHHVEVSKNSQKVGQQRIESKLGKSTSINETLFFHTSPAEYLPFVAEHFDFVFSRSSIHHTLRKLSISEISRVMKTGATFLFFEPIQTTLVNKSMHTLRKIRNIDRGTDDPLTSPDFTLLKDSFTKLDWYPKNIFKNDLSVVLKWISRDANIDLSVPVIFGAK